MTANIKLHSEGVSEAIDDLNSAIAQLKNVPGSLDKQERLLEIHCLQNEIPQLLKGTTCVADNTQNYQLQGSRLSLIPTGPLIKTCGACKLSHKQKETTVWYLEFVKNTVKMIQVKEYDLPGNCPIGDKVSNTLTRIR